MMKQPMVARLGPEQGFRGTLSHRSRTDKIYRIAAEARGPRSGFIGASLFGCHGAAVRLLRASQG